MRLEKLIRAARGHSTTAKKSRKPSVETKIDSSSSASSSEHGLTTQQPLVPASAIVFNIAELRKLIFLFHAINLLKTRMELVKIPITPLALWRAHLHLWDEEALRALAPPLAAVPRRTRRGYSSLLPWKARDEDEDEAPSPLLPTAYLKAVRLVFDQILATMAEGDKHEPRVHGVGKGHQKNKESWWEIKREQNRTLSWLVREYKLYTVRQVCKKGIRVRTGVIKVELSPEVVLIL